MHSPNRIFPIFMALMMGALFWSVSATVFGQSRPSVALETVQKQDILREITLNGTVTALRRSQLSTAVAGLVDGVSVDIGDRVTEGDVLVSLDSEQAALERQSADAELKEARVRLAEARRRLEEAQSVGVGQNIAATEVRTRENEVASAEAYLGRMTAQASRLKVILDRHQIRAPFSGVVSAKMAEKGEWVTPGDALLSLVDLTSLKLDFQVPQSFYSQVDETAELTLTPAADHGKSDPLDIETLVPVSDEQARTFLLRASAKSNSSLMPGMAVEATLRTGTGARGLTVSRDAINRYPEGRVTVWIAEKAEEDLYQVREKRIELGVRFDDRVQVTSGLEGNEQIVVRGNESLREGAKVRLAERSAR